MSRRVDQLLADCPTCRVEGALVELFSGRGTEGRCRLCGHATRDGVVVRVGRRFLAVEEVHAALRAWAKEEEEDDLLRFVQSNFLDERLDVVVDRILDGEAVATNFDVLGWLMPGFGGGANVRRGPPLTEVAPPEPAPLSTAPSPPDPTAAANAMRAVAWADGELHAAERQFLEAAGVSPDGVHVSRPTETGRPEAPEEVVKALIRLALADGVVDASEVRVIREFARAWGVPFDPALLPLGGGVRRTMSTIWGAFVR